jgi:lantibiotic modifying enzyme
VSQGLPGAALVLLALREHHRDNASHAAEVDEALRYAGSLLAAAVPRHRPRPGFGKGTAGFAYASARVGVDIGDPRLSLAAVSVLTDRCGQPAYDTDGSWCSGLAGDLLGLTAMLGPTAMLGLTAMLGPTAMHSHAGLAASRVGLDLDLGRTMAGDAARRLLVGIDQATIAPGNDSLCHGDLGMAEALTRAGAALGDDEPGEVGARLARLVADRALAGDLRGGAPTGVWTPGLLTGAAGVGYGLIQTAAPDRVPSVTLVELEPPSGAPAAWGARRW